jgi:hypothetical protein
MASTTNREMASNPSKNLRNSSEEGNRGTPSANGVMGEEEKEVTRRVQDEEKREVTRRVQIGEEREAAIHVKTEVEYEPVAAEASNISREKGRGRPRMEQSNMIMQLGEEEDEPKAAGMASISRKRGRPRKDQSNIIMSTIEEEASEEDSEGSMNDCATRKSRRRAKKRISCQLLEEESLFESNEDEGDDGDFGLPAKKRGRRGPKPRLRSITMASASANGGTPIMIPPMRVEKKKRRVAKTPAANVEREIPEGIFDEFWDSEDEEVLVSQWTREYEVVLQSTTPAENALWKRAFQLFNQPAPKLLPPYIPIDVSENETVLDPDNEDLEENEGLKNTNWSPTVCALFGEVMCCPAFSGRPDYLQYVLALALYLRVGATYKFPKPELPVSRRQLIVDEFMRLSREPVDEETLLQATENVEGRERLPHQRFVRFLEKDCNAKKAKWKTKKAKGLVKADFTAIVEAWDKYAVESPNMGLSTMKEYTTRWETSMKSKKKKKKHSSEDILRLKREYMLSTWRDWEKEKRARAARRAQKRKEVERVVTPASSPSHGDDTVNQRDEPSPSSHMKRDRLSDASSVTLQEDLVQAPEEPNERSQSSHREINTVRDREILTVHDFERYLSELEWSSNSGKEGTDDSQSLVARPETESEAEDEEVLGDGSTPANAGNLNVPG